MHLELPSTSAARQITSGLATLSTLRMIRPLWNPRIHTKEATGPPDTLTFLASVSRRGRPQNVILRRVTNEHDNQTQSAVDFLRNLQHPNIERILGMCTNGSKPRDTFLVVPSAERLWDYLAQYPPADRRCLLLDASCGLAFLHEHQITHGEMLVRNAVVTKNGRLALAGFSAQTRRVDVSGPGGPARVSRALPEWAKDVSDLHWSWRREQRLKEFTFQQEREFERQDYWGADSYDDLTSNRRETSVADAEASLQARRALQSHNIQEDLFAFGFFIIEVFSGRDTCGTCQGVAFLKHVLRGDRPSVTHPGRMSRMRGLDDILWQLCLRCWGLSDLPLQSINEIVMALDPLHGENYVECPLLWREEDLESWIESRTPALRLRLGARIERFEEITAERDIARLHRGVEIKAVLPTSTGPCEVKVIQMWRHRRTELEKGHALAALGQTMVWYQLHHENVLPLLGTCVYGPYDGQYCFVVPWMANGTALDYIRENPEADRLSLSRQVASGLNYLHTRSPVIIHGNIVAHSILVSGSGVAHISNFDFSPYEDPYGERLNNGVPDSSLFTIIIGGPKAWRAPHCWWHSQESDVFSYGVFMWELFSGREPPFRAFNTEIDPGKDFLDRPSSAKLDDNVWDLIRSCWLESRPSIHSILECLTKWTTAESTT